MIKKTHKFGDIKIGDDDAIIDIITHNGVKMFHCCLHTKYLYKGGNHILATEMLGLCEIIKRAIGKGNIRFLSYQEDLSDFFIHAMKVSDKKDIMMLDESVYDFTVAEHEDCLNRIKEVSILSKKFLKEDTGTHTTKDLGIGI